MGYYQKVSDLFVLFTGTNGKKTWGCMIRSDKTEAECKRHGYQYEWRCNTYTLNSQSDEELHDMGFSREEIDFIREEENANS